jgi:dihydrofolate synthase/folylpolyglutamate synthase
MEAYVESGGGEEWIPPRYAIPLLGYHQVINCATARVALEILRDKGWRIPEEDIQRGFREVSFPGRFQILTHDPFVVVDSAHNRDSALRLRIALDDYFPGQPVTLIFGASADKDIRGMLGELLPRVSRLILTRAVHPRAASTEALTQLANGYGLQIESIVPVIQALRHGIEMARPGEVVLAAGSLFVVGEILATRDFSNNRIAYAKEEVK